MDDYEGVETLEGNLANISLIDVLSMITNGGLQGTLEISSANVVKKIFFREKGVSISSFPPNVHWRLGDLLIEMGRITPEQLEQALQEQRNSQALLGQILLRNNFISYEDIHYTIRRQIKEELFELFQWKNAKFVFLQGVDSPEAKNADSRVVDLSFNTSRYVLNLAGVLGTFSSMERDGILHLRGVENQIDLEFRSGILYMGTHGIDTEQSFLNFLLASQVLTEGDLAQLPPIGSAYEKVEALGKIPHLPELYYEWMASLFLHILSEPSCTYEFYSHYPLTSKSREPILSASFNFRDILLQALIRIEDWEPILNALPLAKKFLPTASGQSFDLNQLDFNGMWSQLEQRLNHGIDYTQLPELNPLSRIEVLVLLTHFIREGFIVLLYEFFDFAKFLESSNRADLQQQTLVFMQKFYPWEFALYDQLATSYRIHRKLPEAAYYNAFLAKFYKGEERYQVIQKALNLDPNSLFAQQELIYYYLEEKRIERALPIAKKLVLLQLQEQRFEEAEELAQIFIEEDHEAPAFFNLFIKEYQQKKLTDKLLATLKSFVVYDEARGRYESLFNLYKQILEIDSSQIDIKEKLSALKKQGIGKKQKNNKIPLLLVTFILLAVGGYFFFLKPSPTLNPLDSVAEQQKVFEEAQNLERQGEIHRALQELNRLLSAKLSSNMYLTVSEFQRKLKGNQQQLETLVSQYQSAKNDKKFHEAKNHLEQLFTVFPPLRQKMKKETTELEEELQKKSQLYQQLKREITSDLEKMNNGTLFKTALLSKVQKILEENPGLDFQNPQESFFNEQKLQLEVLVKEDQKKFKEILERGEQLFLEGNYQEAYEKSKNLPKFFTTPEEEEKSKNFLNKCKELLEVLEQQKSLLNQAKEALRLKNLVQAQKLLEELIELFPDSTIANQASEELSKIGGLEAEAKNYLDEIDTLITQGQIEKAYLKAKNFPSQYQKTTQAKKLFYPLFIDYPNLSLEVFHQDQFLGKTPYTFKQKDLESPPALQLALDGYSIEVKGIHPKKPWLLEFSVNKGARFTLETNSPIISQPCIINNKLLLCSKDGIFQFLDPTTGNEYWNYSVASAGKVLDTPLYSNSTLYFGTFGGKIFFLKIRSDESGMEVFKEIEIPEAQFLYQPLLLENTLLFASQNGMIYAFDASNGSSLWKKNVRDFLPNERIAISSRFTEYRGQAFLPISLNGQLIRISNSGEIKLSRNLGGKVLSMVSFGKNLVVATNRGLSAFSSKDLNEKSTSQAWKSRVPGTILGLTPHQDQLWVASDESLFSFLSNGDTRLESDQIHCRSPLEVGADKLYITTPKGLSAYSFEGKFFWLYEVSKPLYIPFYYKNTIFFGSENGIFYAIPAN
jgi:outer membrane protein assembly factor BamB